MSNVSLTPALEGFAKRCVASGRYDNISEVMRAALRLLQEKEEKFAVFTLILKKAELEDQLIQEDISELVQEYIRENYIRENVFGEK